MTLTFAVNCLVHLLHVVLTLEAALFLLFWMAALTHPLLSFTEEKPIIPSLAMGYLVALL